MEISEHGRVTRATIFVAAFAVAMMLVPSLMIGNQNLNPADNASAVGTNRVLRIGWPDYYQNIGTLNPHTMTMGQEYMLVYNCYSELLTYDENNQVIGDLAKKWTVSPDGKDWHFWIVDTATFYDRYRIAKGQALYPVTADDVMFSFYLTQNNSVSIMNYYFPKDPDTYAPMISSITRVNDYELIFHLRESFGPFLSALTGVPIVPKYVWDGKNIGWANYDSKTPPIVGSGAYYYALDNIAQIQDVGASMIMNPTWFGITERGWQPHVYEFKVMSETTSSGIQSFNNGYLDILIAPTPGDFKSVTEGGQYNIKKYSSSQGFVLDMCINQLTPELRAYYNMDGAGDTNNQILRDPVVKRALKMTVNKTAVVEFSLEGGGSPADSLMPAASMWYYDYGSNPELDTQLIPDSGDIQGARTMLMNAGWKYRADSSEILPTDSDFAAGENAYYPLYQAGATLPLQFRFEWASWYAEIDNEGPRVQGWAAQAGIDLYTYGGPGTSAELNGDWKTGDYDIYLWDWWFSPMVEPSLDVCELYHTNSIGNNTDVNDYYPPFDDWYYASLRTTDFTERKELVDTMQRWAYENSGYWPIAYRDNTYLAQTTTRQGGQGWTNYGDWVAHYTLCPDSDYWWLFLKIYPADQPSPTIGTFSIDPADTEHPITYTAEATDTNNMEYRWIFGDGTSTSWSSSMDVIKTYADDGYYEARLVVRESDGSDNFMVFAKQTVTVINNTNVLPVVNAWTPSPSNPTLGELVYFNGSATDANTGDTLSYSWDFGDGNITAGQSVTHRFIESTGVYSVKLSVDDGHLGTVPRPATKTQSLQILSNGPPYEVAVGDYGNVGRNVPYTFSLTASDPNPRDVLRYTWVWGDGQTSVTTTKSTRHTYQNNALYTLTVWADDQTGIAGHNVSDTGLVQVKNPTGNTAPTMTTSGFGVSAATPWTGKVVQFWANATDANGNLLDIVIDFGDGTTSGTITQSDPNATVTVTHVYETEDMFFPSVTFTDQIAAAITRYSTDMVPSWYVTSQGAYFDLDLVTGWNFVTVPPMNYGYTASMLGGTVDQVAKWDPVAPGYVIWWSMFPTKNNFAIEGSTGYWVLATAPGTVRLFGDMPTTSQTRTITVPTGGAWVMIGFNSLRTDWTATSVVGMYTGGTVQQVAKWNPVAGYTIWWDMFPTKNNFALVPGQSYWILVTASGQLTYTP